MEMININVFKYFNFILAKYPVDDSFYAARLNNTKIFNICKYLNA